MFSSWPRWVMAAGVTALLLLLDCPAYAQNTKGDRPAVRNQRQVRETNAKSVRKKEKGRTRDIANRRLRTKDKSSASRANAKHPRENPYYGRKSKAERPATARGRIFSKSPRESHVRAWKGDVSGYPLKRVHPTNSDAARNNVYPQKGPYVRYARKQPKAKPPIYSKTIKGVPFVRHEPRHQERAWKGGLDGGPIKNQSASGSVRNTFPQKGPYVAYYRKRGSKQSKPISNTKEVSRAKRLTRVPRTGGSQPTYYPNSASRPFIQRGRKDVYWGKYQRKERGVTGDLTGAPLRTRNYRSTPAGLVGRDTVKFFGRKPIGDRGARTAGGGYSTKSRRGQQGWKGDVSGYPLRKRGPAKYNRQQALKPTEPGIGALWLSKTFNRKFRGVKPADRMHDRRAARFQGNIPSSGAAKTFDDQGAGYRGDIRRGEQRSFGRQGAGYSGNIKGGRRKYGRGPAGYSGNIPAAGAAKTFGDQGAGYSGDIPRGLQRGFDKQGAGFAGNIKTRRPPKGGGSISGSGWNNNNRSVSVNIVRGNDIGAARYRGNFKRWQIEPYFTNQGAGYSGYIKARRPEKGGGSVSGTLWNNRNTAIDSRVPLSQDARAAGYSGTLKLKRPEKGGGSVSGKLWNNRNTSIDSRVPLSQDAKAAGYSGTLKLKRPEKGGGSVSGKLWNNSNSAIGVRTPLAQDAKAANYSGRIKHSKKNYEQNPNASKLSLKKESPDATTFKVSGLQVKVRENETRNKPNVKKGGLPGIAPSKASVKANEYSRSMKVLWDYKRNPNSSKDARPGIPPKRGGEAAGRFVGRSKAHTYKHNPNSNDNALKVSISAKATARTGDYQGNQKMHKYKGAGLHPDAQFAHSYRDNVKEERTMLMSVKLIWGKLFRKSETQPENLKQKPKKLDYDKREKDLWNK